MWKRGSGQSGWRGRRVISYCYNQSVLRSDNGTRTRKERKSRWAAAFPIYRSAVDIYCLCVKNDYYGRIENKPPLMLFIDINICKIELQAVVACLSDKRNRIIWDTGGFNSCLALTDWSWYFPVGFPVKFRGDLNQELIKFENSIRIELCYINVGQHAPKSLMLINAIKK